MPGAAGQELRPGALEPMAAVWNPTPPKFGLELGHLKERPKRGGTNVSVQPLQEWGGSWAEAETTPVEGVFY